ncbi:MAG: hypothetical protein AB1505_05440 [Candidatus Latescibacterota bacterium]
MLNHETIREHQKWLATDHERIKGRLAIADGQLTITAEYAPEKDNDYAVRDRMYDLMKDSGRLLEKIYGIEEEVEEQRLRELGDKPLGSLDTSDIFVLVGDNLSEYAVQSGGSELGVWGWTLGDTRNLQVINRGDEVVFSQWFDVGPDPAVKRMVLERAVGEAKRAPLKHATATVVEEPAYPNRVAVRARYDLKEGTVRAEHIRSDYQEFNAGYSEALYKRMAELIGRANTESWQTISGAKPTYLAKQELSTVINDDLSSLEKANAQVKEGFYAFTRNKRLNLEVSNFGDALKLVLWWQYPRQPGDERRQKDAESLNKFISDNRLAHAQKLVVEALPTKDYPNVIEVDASIPVNGTYTNQQLREIYADFTNAWGDRVHERAVKLIK